MKKYQGIKYNRLTILELVDRISHPSGGVTYKYKCRCDCGKEVVVSLGNLKSGHTGSCGCLNKELLSARRKTLEESKAKFLLIEAQPIENQTENNFTDGL